MLIVLDTNVFQEDFRMKSGRFRVVLDYAERTQATFLLPRIVLDELAANYRRELNKRLAALVRAQEQLSGIYPLYRVPHLDVDIERATEHYVEVVKERLHITRDKLLESRPEYLGDVLSRAIERRRPCSERGEEIRDVVLWLTILDAAAERKEPVLFVSKNTGQFSADKQHLHPELAAEAARRSLSIEYLPSLEEFARQHATKIAFITSEWLERHIDADLVLDAAYDYIMEAAHEVARSQTIGREQIESDFRLSRGGVEIAEFFVNVLGDGQLRVETHWWGRVIVEYRVSGNADDPFDYWPTRASYGARTGVAEVKVSVTTQALIRDEAVVEWSVVDSWIERY